MRRFFLSLVLVVGALAGNAAAGTVPRVKPVEFAQGPGAPAASPRLTVESIRPASTLSRAVPAPAAFPAPVALSAAPAVAPAAAHAIAPVHTAAVKAAAPGTSPAAPRFSVPVPPKFDPVSLDAFFEQSIARGDAVVGDALATAISRNNAGRAKPVDFGLGRRLALLSSLPDGTQVGLMTRHNSVPVFSEIEIYGRPLPGALRDIIGDLPRKAGSLLRLAASKVGLADPPKRLLAGEHAWPYRRAGDLTMDVNPAVRPQIVGSISSPPLRDGAVREIYWERMAYQEFTGKNAGAMKEAARILIPGGRLDIRTGDAAPIRAIIRGLEAAGFVKIVVRRNGDISAWTAAI